MERKTLNDSDLYYQDNQDSTKENNPLIATIGIGLAALGGWAAYKAGVFKPIMKGLTHLAGSFSNKTGAVTEGIRDWANLNGTQTPKARIGSETLNIPTHSLFKHDSSNMFADFFRDIDDLGDSSLTKFARMRTVISDTKEDLSNLNKIIKAKIQGIPAKKATYYDTDLEYRLGELSRFQELIQENDPTHAASFGDKAMQAFRDAAVLTPEMRSAQLKRTGSRSVVLGDLLEFDPNKRDFTLKSGAPIDITQDPRGNMPLSKRIFRTLTDINSWIRDANGNRKTLVGTGDWENIILDTAMRIDENGKFIDMRMTKAQGTKFIESLMGDFGIPVMRFNPLRSISNTVAGLFGKDINFKRNPLMGLLDHNQIDPGLTRQSGRVSIGDWLGETLGDNFKDRPVAVINGKAYVGEDQNNLIEVASNLKLYDVTYADRSTRLPNTLDAARQMANLHYGGPSKYEGTVLEAIKEYENEIGRPLTFSEKLRFGIGRTLDMGFQESAPAKHVDLNGNVTPFNYINPDDEAFDMITSPEYWTDKFFRKLTERVRMTGFEYDSMDDMLDSTAVYNARNIFGYHTFTKESEEVIHQFATLPKGFSFQKAFKYASEGNTKDAWQEFNSTFLQYLDGRRIDGSMGKYFTAESGRMWGVFNALDAGIARVAPFLAFSPDSKGSTVSFLGNFLLKRVLPAYMLLQVPDMLAYMSEPFFDKEDQNGTNNKDNLFKNLMRNVVKPIDLSFHKAMDVTGITQMFKSIQDFTPGFDQITELPGIYQLGLGQTKREREEYIERGMDPVRKNRFWGANNTPFTGDKIMYWRPNIYRRIQADVDFSDSKYGSRQEYFNNTWYPNLANPFAPFNHFLFDRNHYDKKHKYDRPYLKTALEGSNIPLIGPAFSVTLGSELSPPHKMHHEKWDTLFQNIKEDAVIRSSTMTNGFSKDNEYNSNIAWNNMDVLNELQERELVYREYFKPTLDSANLAAHTIIRRSIKNDSGIDLEQITVFPNQDSKLALYITPYRSLNIVDMPANLNLVDVNNYLREHPISHIEGVNERVRLDSYNNPDVPVGLEDKKIDSAFIHGLGQQYNMLTDVMGLRGYILRQHIFGQANKGSAVIEDSSWAYSINRKFWDQNLGGLGGTLSEIVRRFIPKRDNNTEYINPIRNTMPSWMPGSDYMIDFKHGDPYTKVSVGEERLPGEGYERLWGIKNVGQYKVNLDRMGYDQETIQRSMIPNSGLEIDSNRNTKATKHMKSFWRQSKAVRQFDVTVDDRKNGLEGSYDAAIYDANSKTGLSLVNIKSVNHDLFKTIKKQNAPLVSDQREMNYLLWATNNTEGKAYIHYVDESNPEKSVLIDNGKFNRKLFKDTLATVQSARSEMKHLVDTGQMGRGEFYPLVDRFRILADTAPYSQEFRDIQAQLATADLSNAEREEISEIKKRLTEQKKPFRTYPYRFKYATLKSQEVTVDKIIDNSHFTTKEFGTKHAIRFAGISVTESGEIEEGQSESKKDRAAKEVSRFLKPGKKIRIDYAADESQRYAKDLYSSIYAVIHSNGKNVNKQLLDKGHAKLKESEENPAAMHVKYSKGDMAKGSFMESFMHDFVGNIPFIGSSLIQVKSPYERYRDREIYGKDFQSWDHPIRDIFNVNIIDRPLGKIAEMGAGGIVLATLTNAFVGSLFGSNRFGKIVGTIIGGAIPLIGAGYVSDYSKKHNGEIWKPKRRRKEENINEYMDMLKYVKNTRLYNHYADLSEQEGFDVRKYIEEKDEEHLTNKVKVRELEEYKKLLKINYKEKDKYDFKLGPGPKYVTKDMTRKEAIAAINQEIKEIKSDRQVEELSENALKAIYYDQLSKRTAYGYQRGDSYIGLISSLPKKDAQYFQEFMKAPEQERKKILRIAPKYMRRALQTVWGDKSAPPKENINLYFSQHALPDEDWVGWQEDVDLNDVKVKIVHQEKADPGEFNIWDKDEQKADETNIPIPNIDAKSDPKTVSERLKGILGDLGYEDVQVDYMKSILGKNKIDMNVQQDMLDELEQYIESMDFSQ